MTNQSAHECLRMIEEELVAIDGKVKLGDTSPMFFPEWIRALVATQTKRAEKAEAALREHETAIKDAGQDPEAPRRGAGMSDYVAFETVHPVSKKDRQCDGCRRIIKAVEKYEKMTAFGVYEKRWYHVCYCARCSQEEP